MEKELVPYTKEFTKDFVINDENIIDCIAIHIDALIYNIVSTISLIALMNGERKISRKFIDVAQKYISEGNKKLIMKGGALPLEYTGQTSGSYAPFVPQAVDISKIDFAAGIARPALGIQMGGSAAECVHNVPVKFVKSVLSHHAMKYSDHSMNEIRKMIKEHLCELHDKLAKLSDGKKHGITMSMLERIFSKKSFAVFN